MSGRLNKKVEKSRRRQAIVVVDETGRTPIRALDAATVRRTMGTIDEAYAQLLHQQEEGERTAAKIRAVASDCADGVFVVSGTCDERDVVAASQRVSREGDAVVPPQIASGVISASERVSREGDAAVATSAPFMRDGDAVLASTIELPMRSRPVPPRTAATHAPATRRHTEPATCPTCAQLAPRMRENTREWIGGWARTMMGRRLAQSRMGELTSSAVGFVAGIAIETVVMRICAGSSHATREVNRIASWRRAIAPR